MNAALRVWPASSPGSPLTIVKDGSNEIVTIYGKIFAADSKQMCDEMHSTNFFPPSDLNSVSYTEFALHSVDVFATL